MERMGLVSQVEAELEKMLSLELLPESRTLPSENKLSRCFGVSRGTVREALLRLAAKGLVVTHPGRQAQAVPLGQAVSLENLGVLLDGDGKLRPERWKLLEGYLALKRDMAVELLAACCEKASAADLEQLGQDCYALADAARWDTGERKWVWQEFDLLRLAAVAADRPGHLLLIHSLERAFRDMARWMQPCLDSKTVSDWARFVMNALTDRDAQKLRNALPPLLQAGDERLLLSLAPRSQPTAASESHITPSAPLACTPSAPEPTQLGRPDEVSANLSDSCTGSFEVPPAGASSPASIGVGACSEPEDATPAEVVIQTGGLGEVSANLSDRWTGSHEVPPTGAPSPESISARTGPGAEDGVPEEDGAQGLQESWSGSAQPVRVQPGETLPMPRPGSPPVAAHSCTQPCCCSE
jgi:GntR family transcriptional repressor for pyruvate dehydrogenase complex